MNYYIVIPCYNEEKFIALTLKSLAEQTVLPKKIVIVNLFIICFPMSSISTMCKREYLGFDVVVDVVL